MKFLNDLLPVFKKRTLVFSEKKQEIDNVFTFLFKSSEKIDWKPGQHGIFTVSASKLEGGSWRGFSVASTPDEAHIMISTRIAEKPSAFKKALMDLKPGDSITMRGPFGPFYIDHPSKPVVFIAGGIGITPFRALIRASVNDKSSAPSSIDLLYIDSKGTYAYKDYLDELANEHKFVNIKYLTDKDVLAKEIGSCVENHKNNADYFISGPPAMVKALKDKLVSLGIKKSNINNENFLGYK